ncbi:hypothetical protein Tco_1051800, partial [Tanacetum coccineum]
YPNRSYYINGRAGEDLQQESTNKQKMDDDKEKELKQCFEIVLDDGDDVTIDATPLSVKIPVVDYKIYQKGKKVLLNYQRVDCFKLTMRVKWHMSFLDWSRNSSRKAMYLNEVFGSILLVKIKLLIKKLEDSKDEHQV